MTRMALLIGLTGLLVACDAGERPRLPLPTQPSAAPAPNPAPPPPTVRVIEIGEEITDVFRGTDLAFEFTAPRSGRLVARLTWDVWFNGSLLTLALGSDQARPVPPAWSPLVGKWDVIAGQTYRLTVGGGGTDWWYDDRFVLTAIVEEPSGLAPE